MKSSVYLETTFISYLVAQRIRPGSQSALQQIVTRRWWQDRSSSFDLFASGVVLDEARKGDPEIAAVRVSIVNQVALLDVTSEALTLRDELMRRTRIPTKAEIDALHIAVAAVNGMDYLLTWNCTHMANPIILPKVYDVCRAAGYEPPFVCTPHELMKS